MRMAPVDMGSRGNAAKPRASIRASCRIPCGLRDVEGWHRKTEDAITSIVASAPTVWGGDWNHAMAGRDWSGSKQGRRSLLEAVDQLGLQLPTADSPHQIEGLLSIDHIAVPAEWSVLEVEHRPALVGGAKISDHDAYVVEVSS